MRLRKLIAPCIITALLVACFIGLEIACLTRLSLPPWAKVVSTLVLLGLTGMSIFVLVERINEVRSGEEDDLSQY